jgi:hypothetical protein
MRTSKAVKIVALLLGAAFLTTPVFAGSTKKKSAKNNKKKEDHYVMVTGSNIPKKGKVKSIGNTSSNLRVYKRDEINRMGRVTTAGVVAWDPAVTVRGR